jgi:hypothetical protein
MPDQDQALLVSQRRARIAGPSGLKGMFANGKTTLIAIFAALGGFVYGCMYFPPVACMVSAFPPLN